MVLHSCEELHDDLDLFFDQQFTDFVLGPYDVTLVDQFQAADGRGGAGDQILQKQNVFGLEGHVSDLVVIHVVVGDCFFDFHEFLLVGVHDLLGVAFEVLLETGAFKDALELLEQVDLLFDRTHVLLALADVHLDVGLLLADVHGELDLVLVEDVVVNLQLVVVAAFERGDYFFEFVDILLVDVLVLQDVDLFLDEEHFNQFGEFALETVEQREDQVGVVVGKVEVGVVAHVVVRAVVVEAGALVGVEFDALVEDLDEFLHGLEVPELLEVVGLLFDEVLAASDHLVGQLSEQFDDVRLVALVLVDVVDHADGVQQQRQLVDYFARTRLLQLLDLAFQLRELLVVVLGLSQLAVQLVLQLLELLLLLLEVVLGAGNDFECVANGLLDAFLV